MNTKINVLIENLLSSTNASEIAQELALMNEVYIEKAQVDRTALANTTSLMCSLTRFFYELEKLKVPAKIEHAIN